MAFGGITKRQRLSRKYRGSGGVGTELDIGELKFSFYILTSHFLSHSKEKSNRKIFHCSGKDRLSAQAILCGGVRNGRKKVPTGVGVDCPVLIL